MKQTTASFLFADVKGYSKLTEYQVKCFYQEILPKLKLKVDEYKEHLTDINTWGDGLMIVSEAPYNLARLSLDIRDFYNNYNWINQGMPELVVRIALHHGDIYRGIDPFRERESIIGTEVTLGARLEPTTVAGQVWVTHQFRMMIRETKDPSIQFEDIGEQELAKNHGKIQVYQLLRRAEFLAIQPNPGTGNSPPPSLPTNEENINKKKESKTEEIDRLLEIYDEKV